MLSVHHEDGRGVAVRTSQFPTDFPPLVKLRTTPEKLFFVDNISICNNRVNEQHCPSYPLENEMKLAKIVPVETWWLTEKHGLGGKVHEFINATDSSTIEAPK